MLKEHHGVIWVEHADRSAMVEYSINLGHCVQLHNNSILSIIWIISSKRWLLLSFIWIIWKGRIASALSHKNLTCSLTDCRKPSSQGSPLGHINQFILPLSEHQSALSRHLSTLGLSFLSWPSAVFVLHIPKHMSTIHLHDFPSILVGSQPTTHTYDLSPACEQLALPRAVPSHYSSVSYWFALVLWKSQWQLMI
jgi:hypothetical protein